MAEQTCIIIGASHGGVNLAFALRREGFEGKIQLFDADPTLPYHRPPLSKAYLTSDDAIEKNALKSEASYEKSNLELHLGVKVTTVSNDTKSVTTENGEVYEFDFLVLATGARPFIPPIKGIKQANQLYPLRTAMDVSNIKAAANDKSVKKAVIIGGGYIGLETAASLKKLGLDVTVLEREPRVLARVTAPEMSDYFQQLHTGEGINLLVDKNVECIEQHGQSNQIICTDGERFDADLIVVGVGIRVNTELAEQLDLTIENGIKVNHACESSKSNVYAIGDCCFHHNRHYDRWIRLESVQNAVDQAKVAAKAITGKEAVYDALPWFWSDQFSTKLQMVGLATGYTEVIIRKENGEGDKFSAWYFKGDELLSVDTVNNAKAYVIATRLIKARSAIDKTRLVDPEVELKPDSFVK